MEEVRVRRRLQVDRLHGDDGGDDEEEEEKEKRKKGRIMMMMMMMIIKRRESRKLKSERKNEMRSENKAGTSILALSNVLTASLT